MPAGGAGRGASAPNARASASRALRTRIAGDRVGGASCGRIRAAPAASARGRWRGSVRTTTVPARASSRGTTDRTSIAGSPCRSPPRRFARASSLIVVALTKLLKAIDHLLGDVLAAAPHRRSEQDETQMVLLGDFRRRLVELPGELRLEVALHLSEFRHVAGPARAQIGLAHLGGHGGQFGDHLLLAIVELF